MILELHLVFYIFFNSTHRRKIDSQCEVIVGTRLFDSQFTTTYLVEIWMSKIMMLQENMQDVIVEYLITIEILLSHVILKFYTNWNIKVYKKISRFP